MLYEGKITVCEQKKSGKGGTIRLYRRTWEPKVEMGFWSRPDCMQDMPAERLAQARDGRNSRVYSLCDSAKESNGRIYRNVETLDLVEEA